MIGMESAIEARLSAGSEISRAKLRRDSQGSLPKTGTRAYLDDNATEL
jgi:hypothetical protein